MTASPSNIYNQEGLKVLHRPGQSHSPEEEEEWPDPAPLEQEPPPPLDLCKAIPSTLPQFREFIEATAESIQISHDAVAAFALAVASVGTSRAFEICPSNGWTEPAPLWVAVLLNSGERKSQLVRSISKPIHDWEELNRLKLGKTLDLYSEERRQLDARLCRLRTTAAKATGQDLKEIKTEIEGLILELGEKPVLELPMIATGDATPEAMRDLLFRNGEKLVLVSAETDPAQLMGNRYSKSGDSNISLMLAAHAGDLCRSHRIGKEVPLERPALAIALCVQPSALSTVIRDQDAKDRGLIPRFMFVTPQSMMGRRKLDTKPVPPHLGHWWSSAIAGLLNKPWPDKVVDTSAGIKKSCAYAKVLTLSQEAKAVHRKLREEIERELKEDGELQSVRSFASKLPGTVARIALVFETLSNPDADEISGPSMEAACAWAPWLIEHYRYAMGQAGVAPEMVLAQRLLRRLQKKGEATTTERDTFNLRVKSEVSTMDEFAPVLIILEKHGWIRSKPQTTVGPKGGRPPSPAIEINPKLFTMDLTK